VIIYCKNIKNAVVTEVDNKWKVIFVFSLVTEFNILNDAKRMVFIFKIALYEIKFFLCNLFWEDNLA
jgi:hypothetical protein